MSTNGLAGRRTPGTTYYLIEAHLGVDRTGENKARLDTDKLTCLAAQPLSAAEGGKCSHPCQQYIA